MYTRPIGTPLGWVGRRLLRNQWSAPAAEAAGLGTQLAEWLLDQGGREILAGLYGRLI